MITPKTLIALVVAFVLLVGAGLFVAYKALGPVSDVCNGSANGPYSNPSLTPFGTSTAIFIRFNGEGKGCAYIPATDSWTNLSKLVTE